MPEVTICAENVRIPTLGVGILFTGEGLECLPEYFVKDLSVCLPLPFQPLLRKIAVLDWNRQESDDYDGVH